MFGHGQTINQASGMASWFINFPKLAIRIDVFRDCRDPCDIDDAHGAGSGNE